MQTRLQGEGGAERFKHVISFFIGQLNKGKRRAKAEVTTTSPPSEDGVDPTTTTTSREEDVIDDRVEDTTDWQRGCPNRFLTLTAIPLWGSNTFEWMARFESEYEVILAEFLQLRNSIAPSFQPYRSPRTDSSECSRDELGQLATSKGNWNVSYLYLHGVDFQENVNRCPNTVRIINETLPRHYHHAFFSALSPDTHISSHYGPTNKKIRIHLPLIVNTNGGRAWLRVADKRVELEAGKAVMFDDSFEHEAGNDNKSTPRVVLVVDIWHPDLSDEEVKFLSFINKGQIAAAKKLKERAAEEAVKEASNNSNNDADESDFLSIIQNIKQTQLDAEPGIVMDALKPQIWYDVRDD
jgi:aspartate beta-hydroxylase